MTAFLKKRGNKLLRAEIDAFVYKLLFLDVGLVNAGKSGTLKSLHQFAYLRNARHAVRFDLNQPSWQEIRHAVTTSRNTTEDASFGLLSLPLYAIEELYRLLAEEGT